MRMDKSIALQELEKLMQAHSGTLSPEIVVDAARPDNAPLHNQFEWDDGIAGEKYRIEQARGIIKVFTASIQVGPDVVLTARFQIAGTPENDGRAHYEDILHIVSDAEKSYQLAVATLERARDILQRCPHKVTQKMALRISTEIHNLPRPKRKK